MDIEWHEAHLLCLIVAFRKDSGVFWSILLVDLLF